MRFWIVIAVTLVVAPELSAQTAEPLVGSDLPPGFVGNLYASTRPSVAGYVQPVQIVTPGGVQATMPVGHTFGEPSSDLRVGLHIGSVYRMRVTGIPGREGEELYPTIEIIDRTYPPPGLALKYPIRIDIDNDDLLAALSGQMVTRVVYLEDTVSASDIAQTELPTRPTEAAAYQDPLDVADALGRPVAIVRIGSLTPPNQPSLLAAFFFGYPVYYPIHMPPAPASVIDEMDLQTASTTSGATR